MQLNLSKSKYEEIKMLTCFLNFKTYVRIFGDVFFAQYTLMGYSNNFQKKSPTIVKLNYQRLKS